MRFDNEAIVHLEYGAEIFGAGDMVNMVTGRLYFSELDGLEMLHEVLNTAHRHVAGIERAIQAAYDVRAAQLGATIKHEGTPVIHTITCRFVSHGLYHLDRNHTRRSRTIPSMI